MNKRVFLYKSKQALRKATPLIVFFSFLLVYGTAMWVLGFSQGENRVLRTLKPRLDRLTVEVNENLKTCNHDLFLATGWMDLYKTQAQECIKK